LQAKEGTIESQVLALKKQIAAGSHEDGSKTVAALISKNNAA
jgi:hypothetical protein